MNELNNALANLVWLRPYVLWLLLLLPLLAFVAIRQYKQKGNWHSVIDSHLLQFLLQSGQSKKSFGSLIGLVLAFIIAIVAAAGPSFKKQSVPVFRSGDARVIILDLSLSMDAVDVKPSRITRAKHKVMDILGAAKEGETGLIVYAGDAFVISPLTSDSNTIATMVPVLSTGVMPILGSEPYSAFREAVQLLKNAGKQQGHLIWLTDGIEDIDVELILEVLAGESYDLSVLTIGSRQGAPIPLPNNKGFLKDSSGQIVMPSLRLQPFQELAGKVNTNIVSLTANSDDVNQIMSFQSTSKEENDESEENIQNQLDQGYWLLLLLCPLGLLLFRKNARLPGISFSIMLGCLILSPPSHANFWDDLWLTKDQQAQKALEKGQAEKAAKLFENPNWKATAQYRAGDFSAAEQSYSLQQSKHEEQTNFQQNLASENEFITQQYNLGNALAKQQKFDDAISAYQKVLEHDPEHEDALFNKKLLEEIQKQQQESKSEQDQNKDNEQQDQNSDQQQNQDQSEQEQQDSEQQKQEQSEEQESEQQSEQQKQQQLEQQEDNRSEQEKQQALEQWLRKIPDDPGGLLRRKMYREYKKRGNENRNVKEVW
ncbi:MAG: VWA domain-containing protein [Gammaproteobacteria bacterium]|nr:VWA domain-containing protein [Gammaproteobacteria bacterium]